jgi:hypothetical protein
MLRMSLLKLTTLHAVAGFTTFASVLAFAGVPAI